MCVCTTSVCECMHYDCMRVQERLHKSLSVCVEGAENWWTNNNELLLYTRQMERLTNTLLAVTHTHTNAGYCTLVLLNTGFDLCTCHSRVLTLLPISSSLVVSSPSSLPLTALNLSSFSCLLPSISLLLSL